MGQKSKREREEGTMKGIFTQSRRTESDILVAQAQVTALVC